MSDESILNEADNGAVDVPNEPTAQPEVTAEVPTEAPAKVEAANFLDSINADLRGQSNINDFKDINDLAKSYVNLQKMVGNSVRIPAEDASAEAKAEFMGKIKDLPGVHVESDDKDAFFNKLGRPEKSADYRFEMDINADLQSKVPNVGEEIESFKGIAHEIGLTNDQAQQLVNMRLDTIKGMAESQTVDRDARVSQLKELWGGEYQDRLNAAGKVAGIYKEKYGEDMSDLINGPAGSNPAFLSMLNELASGYKESGHSGMQQSHFGMTPEMAQDKIMDKKSDAGFAKALHDRQHPGHKKALSEMTKLYQIANGASS